MRKAGLLLAMLLLSSAAPVLAGLGSEPAPATQPGAQPGARGGAPNATAAPPPPPAQSLPPPVPSGGQDWPTFKGGPDRAGVSAGRLPQAPTLLWQTGSSADGGVLASPVVAQGVVVFASLDKRVYAVDAASGLQRWTWDAGALLLGAPAVAGSAVLVPVSDGRLVSLDLANGTERWTARLNGTMSGSPLVYRDHVIVATEDGNVASLDLRDGSAAWNRSLPPLLALVSPALAAGRVVVGDAGGTVWALHVLTGGVLWKADVGGAVTSTPAAGDGLVFVTGMGVKALDGQTGRVLWARDEGGAVRSSPAYHAGVLVVGGGEQPGIAGVNAQTGQRMWFVPTRLFVRSAPVIAVDQALASADDGSLFAVSLRNGSLLWTVDAGERVHGSPALANGVVVVGRTDGIVRAYGDAPAPARRDSGAGAGVLPPVPDGSGGVLGALPVLAVLGAAYLGMRHVRDRMAKRAAAMRAPPAHVPLPPPPPKPGDTVRMACPRCACRFGVLLRAGEVATCPACGLRSELRRKAARAPGSAGLPGK